jgi:hypothetical protein
MFITLLLHAPNFLQFLSINAIPHAAVKIATGTCANATAQTTNINAAVTAITNWITGIGAAVCGLGIAVGGIMRATSFGNERRISDSNTAITCAVVGLLTVLISVGLGQWIGGLIGQAC